jgi:zinc protease
MLTQRMRTRHCRIALSTALAAGLLAFCPARPTAQDGPAPSIPPPATPLRPDPTVRQGRLDNGLTFIIKRNQSPAARVAIRLVVNAGALAEDDDQNGVAHLIEHMAFNGTTHFPRTAMVEFFKGIGAP